MPKKASFRKGLALGLAFAFLFNSLGPIPAGAYQLTLPMPGTMVHLSLPSNPAVLRGIKVDPQNPFRFDFVLDRGDKNNINIKSESNRLIKYFLASLTIPEKDLWVNLSPYEKDKIIPNSFGLTEMGRDLLAEDYMLKQITASLIYPEDEIGKKFWKRIYEEAAAKYGTTNIPVNTFNKVWIVPEKAVVYENAKAGTAYVVESKLKVMLECDYLAMNKNKQTNDIGSNIIREIVIPELTKEINENQNFAQLRQVYNSLILATWYKKKIKDSILVQVYADKNKTVGINIPDPQEKEEIYQQYLQAFKKGVYNYIKEEPDPLTQQPVPREYFSGGLTLNMNSKIQTVNHLPDQDMLQSAFVVSVRFDQAMEAQDKEELLRPFWRGERQKIEITEILGSGFFQGIFNRTFKFEGKNIYQPGPIAIGIGHGQEDEQAWMKWGNQEKTRLIFEKRDKKNKTIEMAVWGKEEDEWKYQGDQLYAFWKGEQEEIEITEILEDGFFRGNFNGAFRFEGKDIYRIGRIAIGIGIGKEGEKIWMKWGSRDKTEIIFERRKGKEVIKAAVWVKEDGQWKKKKKDQAMGATRERVQRLRDALTRIYGSSHNGEEDITSLLSESDLKEGKLPYSFILPNGKNLDKPLYLQLETRLKNIKMKVIRKDGEITDLEFVSYMEVKEDQPSIGHSKKVSRRFKWDGKELMLQNLAMVNNGGIDFTTPSVTTEEGPGGEISFHPDPAMIEQLQNSAGFYPVIINIQPLGDLKDFLGIQKNNLEKQTTMI